MATAKKQHKQGWIEAIRMWHQTHHQVYDLILPVIANLLLTLTAWIYVYDMRVESSPIASMFFDRNHDITTGNDIYDGMLNGFICVASVAVLSFIMLGFALYDFRRLIQCWLSLSCLLIMFCVSGSFFSKLLAKLEIENDFLHTVMTLTYGILGIFAFFTNILPLAFHQFYVIANCSLVSLFYLQILPNDNHTTWFILAGIVVWDVFAVLAPLGPLRRVTEKAQDYSEDILRFLMFTSNASDAVGITEAANQSDETEMSSEKEMREDFEIMEVCTDTWSDDLEERQLAGSEYSRESIKKTAEDALNDSSSRLGMGDFVFYSLLVGKAAVSGSILATCGAVAGVILGLIITLTMLTSGDETTPALPVSIFLGMTFHFGILFLVDPIIGRIW